MNEAFKIQRPKKRNPRVIIYDVPKDFSEAQLTEAVQNQNLTDLTTLEFVYKVQLNYHRAAKDLPKIRRRTVQWFKQFLYSKRITAYDLRATQPYHANIKHQKMSLGGTQISESYRKKNTQQDGPSKMRRTR